VRRGHRQQEHREVEQAAIALGKHADALVHELMQVGADGARRARLHVEQDVGDRAGPAVARWWVGDVYCDSSAKAGPGREPALA